MISDESGSSHRTASKPIRRQHMKDMTESRFAVEGTVRIPPEAYISEEYARAEGLHAWHGAGRGRGTATEARLDPVHPRVIRPQRRS